MEKWETRTKMLRITRNEYNCNALTNMQTTAFYIGIVQDVHHTTYLSDLHYVITRSRSFRPRLGNRRG